MPVRLKEIADDLGISMITVSKVLRDKPDVSEQTRRRVLQRVKEVNYRPNMMARGLASGKSYTVGLIVPDLVHTFFAELAKGLSGALRRHSYQLVLAKCRRAQSIKQLGEQAANMALGLIGGNAKRVAKKDSCAAACHSASLDQQPRGTAKNTQTQ
jgi:DNA-binding LacI/PurR family transcriptional regulator